jgi:hypothetical protein
MTLLAQQLKTAMHYINQIIMKNTVLICSIIAVLVACGGVKKTQEAVNTGNYSHAIYSAINNLAENKMRKNHQPYILILEEAYQKNTERELRQISFLGKDGNPANFEAIYEGYTNLKQIQESIKPLMPLEIYDENRYAHFEFRNYDEELLEVKVALSDYLYDNASGLLALASNKYDFRKAYDDFAYLDRINPGYSDTREKMEEAYQAGLDFVKVQVVNETRQIVPERLESELLNFNTYGLDDFWTQYHANPLKEVKYDYEMLVSFKDIRISPEQVQEKQFVKEKQIKDGYTYLEDNNGNLVKDSLGNEIKVDRFKTVQCSFYQFTQHKAAQVTGQVRYVDLRNMQTLNSYPLSSEFIFQHVYANYNGDKRALDNDLVTLVNQAAVPFPSNEQMVYDAGEDLKLRLKDIVVRHKFN